MDYVYDGTSGQLNTYDFDYDYNYNDTGTLYDYSSTSTAVDDKFDGLDGFIAGFLAIIGTVLLVSLAVYIVTVIGQWKVFEKAHKPGWASIIPIYNTYVLFEIVSLKGWYVFLSFIPGVGPLILSIFTIIAMVRLAKAFNKETGFAIGLIFLRPIFVCILGFGSSQYVGYTDNNQNNQYQNNMNNQYNPNPNQYQNNMNNQPMNFDPMTGQPIKPQMNFDPMTGQPLNNNQNNQQ